MSALADVRPGFSLPSRYYRDPDVYTADLDAVWRHFWLFAGHSCQASAAKTAAFARSTTPAATADPAFVTSRATV